MSTRAYYHPREVAVDLADLSRPLYNEIASLHSKIAHPPAPPVLTCLGNGEPMYVWRHASGRYFARHYGGGNPDNHDHPIATMSDEHRRQVEYSQRAAETYGLQTAIEKSTGNGTRLDLAIYGDNDTGFEIQRSKLSRAKAKSRATKSFKAGWQTAWVSDSATDPDWAHHVPTALLTTRGGWDYELPAPNSAWVSIGEFERERDRDRPSGWWYRRKPHQVLLDHLAYLMPAGKVVPVAMGSKGRVSLAFRDACEVIDSCAYPGASVWRPNNATPRQKETTQTISRECHPAVHTPAPQIRRGVCGCGARAATSGVWGGRLCDYCAVRLSKFRPPTGFERCSLCGFHTPTQGHRNGCPEGLQ